MAESKKKNVFEKLLEVQEKLKAPKNQLNKFGNYNYRNAEDILEAVKPLLSKVGATIVISDLIDNLGDRYYVNARVKFIDVADPSKDIIVEASARECETKKGMDQSQITGAASSYARKYALNGLFAIDDTRDADHGDNAKPEASTSPQKTKPQQTTPVQKPELSPAILKIKDKIDAHLKYLELGIAENKKIMNDHKKWIVAEWMSKEEYLAELVKEKEKADKEKFEGTDE